MPAVAPVAMQQASTHRAQRSLSRVRPGRGQRPARRAVDQMQEGAGDRAAAAALRAEVAGRAARAHAGTAAVPLCSISRAVVELVAAEPGTLRPSGPPSTAVDADGSRDAAWGLAKLVTTGSRPAMVWATPSRSTSVRPSDHVAAAFAVDDGTAVRGRAQAGEEAVAGGERAGVQLGIAAGQVDGIGARRRAPRRPAARTAGSRPPGGASRRAWPGRRRRRRHRGPRRSAGREAEAARACRPSERDRGARARRMQAVEVERGLDDVGRAVEEPRRARDARPPGRGPDDGSAARGGCIAAAGTQDRGRDVRRSGVGAGDRRARGPATRFRTTPTTSTSSRNRRKPSTRAATEAPMPWTSTTRRTGRPNRAARSAVEPAAVRRHRRTGP